MDDNLKDGSVNSVAAADVVIVKLDEQKTPPVASGDYYMSEDYSVEGIGSVVVRLPAKRKERKPRRCGYYL